MENPSTARRQLLVIALGSEGSMALLAWGLGWLLGEPALATFHWSWHDASIGFAATLPMLALFLACIRWPVGPLSRIKRFSDEVIRPLFRPCNLLDLALISLTAGIGEEMLFRGVAQGALASWLGFWPGLLLASLLFGLVHPITVTYVVLAALLGIYLGYVWVMTGNLLVAIVAHGFYDFVALVYVVRAAPAPSVPL